MSIKLLLLVVAATVLVISSESIVSAQTLGDIAKKEDTRRKEVKTPGKVYTNENLRSEPGSTPPSPVTQAAGAAPTQQVPPSPSGVQPPKDADKAGDTKKDEAYWKDRITQARSALDRAKTFAEAQQSRINALATDFAARSDPAQRAQIGGDRQKAVAELERVQKEIQDHTKAIAGIEEEARKAGIPAGWVR